MVDATIVSAPKQRNNREENAKMNRGEEVEEWDKPK